MKLLLKRRLNPFLLLTTVIGLSLLAGLSIIYQTQFDEVTSEKQSLEKKVAEKDAEIEALKQNTSQMEARNSDLESQVSTLEEEIDSREDSTSDLEAQVSDLEADVEELRDERNEYRDDFNTVEGDLKTICDNEDNLNENSQLICSTWNDES